MANYHHVSHSPVINHQDNLWMVNSQPSGIYTKQMKSMLNQLEAVLTHYSQVLILRFDIRTFAYTDDNNVITGLFTYLLRHLKQTYQTDNIGYHWTREQEKAKQQHYHCVLILDANKVRHPSRINNFILEMGNTHNVRPWIPENCFYRFKRNEVNVKQNAIYRISYLAKARGKGYKPPQVKNHGSSRIKAKSSV
ncbi:hypothetical protein P20652_2443 [Pseudoalteromonas sp. BSi20652]|uniref:YagK/YfjJ domain-containing protein n=1 Tax=Pseudoalteromonas sp. BSi20652 TaxID=388384 RepID=UPI000231867E|nr:inovirus-type Gp2 protein [Pseudoalteromonas sp. BSi20652]GAA60577.1 hypothetical protein P20652_2443 [Pseudoalteromonas sp. BSi20652]